MQRRIALTVTALVSVSAGPIAADIADEARQRRLSVSPVVTSPVIDGDLAEPAWSAAPQVTELHQLDPVEYDPASEATEIWVTYDAENLYIAARMHFEDPELIRANNLLQQQRVTPDDRLIIILDTFHDRQNGYMFEVNPHGQRGDALLENNNRSLWDWDGIWTAAATQHEGGWDVEVAIPFNTLSFDPNSDAWGINFFRDMPGKQEFAAWSSQGRQDGDIMPRYAGEMSGLEGLEQGLGLDVVPAVAMVSREDHVTGVSEFEFEPSLDVTYRITPQMTITGTLNTDFSATEVDDAQVNLNRFSLFFPEKRDFFLQDAGIFEFGGIGESGRPFFSRRIGINEDGEAVDVIGGLKLTGRQGPWNMGVLAMNQDSLGPLDASTVGVGRVKYNLSDSAYVGAIATYGDPQSNLNASTIGADFQYERGIGDGNEQMRLSGWLQQSNNQGEDRDQTAYGARFLLPNDQITLDLRHERYGEGFDPAMGFVSRTGVNDTRMWFRYRARPDSGMIRSHNYWVWFRNVEDLDGNLQTRQQNFSPLGLQFNSTDFVEFYYDDIREVVTESFDLLDRITIDVGDYHAARYGIFARFAGHRAVSGSFNIGTGGFFDGDRDSVRLNMTWRPDPHFSMRFSFNWNDIELSNGDFISRLYSVRTNVAFNARWAWITLLQYENSSEELGINTRLRWIPVPGQEYFLVLDSGMERVGDSFEQRESEAVLKLSYTFRF
jgi:hypothetical protein